MKSLRSKILIYFASVTTVMILLLVILVRNQIKHTNLPLTLDLSQQIITAKAGEVGAWINQRISELKVLTETEVLISMDMEAIQPFMRRMDASHKDAFESFAIVSLEGKAWVTNDTKIDVSNRHYFQKITQEDLDYVVSDPIISRSNDEPIVVIIHAIRDANGKPVGYINGAIYISKLSAIAAEVKMYDGFPWISDKNGQIFTATAGALKESFPPFDKTLVLPQEGNPYETGGILRMEDANKNPLVVLYAPIPYAEGWLLGIHFHEQNMTQDTDRLQQMILFFGILIIASLILISLFLSASIVKPVKVLQDLMKDVESGKLDIVYSHPGKDELGQLGQSFNKMVRQIKNLIHAVYQEQRDKREAELRALQAQIQPHFLYNTLDTIHWMALEHQADDIVDMVEALTNLFRISLSRGEEIIPCTEEIKHIKSYLYVQKVRYEDKLNYEIQWEEGLNQCKVLKLVIQPLVENAIYHGIKGKKGPGNILIKGAVVGDTMEVRVVDDGIGLQAEKLAQIQAVLAGKCQAEGTGYGMFNVHERIQLMFGQAYGIQITSQYRRGTEVVLRHPLLKIDDAALEAPGKIEDEPMTEGGEHHVESTHCR